MEIRDRPYISLTLLNEAAINIQQEVSDMIIDAQTGVSLGSWIIYNSKLNEPGITTAWI